jgi:hypothetical protein
MPFRKITREKKENIFFPRENDEIIVNEKKAFRKSYEITRCEIV